MKGFKFRAWFSNAEWPEDVYTAPDGSHISVDGHDTEGQAKGVCGLLMVEGFGGDRQEFPVKTWSEPGEQWQVKGDHPTLMRPDETWSGPATYAREAAEDYAKSLRDVGYENVTCEKVENGN